LLFLEVKPSDFAILLILCVETNRQAEMISGQELINREEEFETNFDMGYGISGGQKSSYPLKRCRPQESSSPIMAMLDLWWTNLHWRVTALF